MRVYEGVYLRDEYQIYVSDIGTKHKSYGPAVVIHFFRKSQTLLTKKSCFPSQVEWKEISPDREASDFTLRLEYGESRFIATDQYSTSSNTGISKSLIIFENADGSLPHSINIKKLSYSGPDVSDCIYGGFAFVSVKYPWRVYHQGCSEDSIWLNKTLLVSTESFYMFLLSYYHIHNISMELVVSCRCGSLNYLISSTSPPGTPLHGYSDCYEFTIFPSYYNKMKVSGIGYNII